MEGAFIQLLNSSIIASYIVIAVLLLRFVLNKAPKWINCLLWMVVGIRLLIPVSVESIFSLIPSAKPVPDDIAISQEPAINTGIGILNNSINPIITETFKPDISESANPLQAVLFIASVIWLIGAVGMLLWSLISYIRLRIKVAPSIKQCDNIYICDNISSPFILGIFRPRIYLPSSITEQDIEIVLRHEKAHISRLDHIWKPISFVLLSVYWFNPLIWTAYILLCRDIEKACDQKVIASMDKDDVRQYSHALLSYSTSSVKISACPLAFGEVGVKSRIKSILNYKRPAFWIIIVSVILVVGIAIGFLTDPITDKNTSTSQSNGEQITPKYGETDP